MEHVTEATFQEQVLNSDKPVVVDFYADWCGPCKQLAPVFEEVASEVSDVKFVKLNVEDAARVAQQYGVRGIPTMILFKGGQRIADKVGLVSKDDLKSFATSA